MYGIFTYSYFIFLTVNLNVGKYTIPMGYRKLMSIQLGMIAYSLVMGNDLQLEPGFAGEDFCGMQFSFWELKF